MRRRYVLAALALVAAISLAIPAFGGPSPLRTAKRALKIGKQADRRARLALSQIRAGVPTAVQAEKAEKAEDADKLAGRPASDFVPAGKVTAAPTFVKLSAGETKAVLEKGPIKFEAECTDQGLTGKRIRVILRTTENGTAWDAGDGLGNTFGPSTPVTWIDHGNNDPRWLGFPFSIAVPSGMVLAGHASAGVNVLGAQCVATAVAIGS